MSTKSRKSLSTWSPCIKCQCISTQKDLHEKDCPPCTENVEREYSFILNGVLYSTVGLYQPQELPKNVSEKASNGMVFISPSAMQFCNIPIGNTVVVETNNAKVVKIAFPTNDTNLISASLTKQAIDLDNLSGPMKVYLLEDDVHIAKEIVLKQLSKHSICESMNVEVDIILKSFNEHKIFIIGNRIMIPFYGKKLTYEIAQIKSKDGKQAEIKATDENDLSTALEKINLETKSSKTNYFKALYTTKWTILQKEDKDENSKIPKRMYRIKDIGGYDDLISNIRDVVQIGIGKYKSIKDFGANKGVLLHGPPGVGKSLIANAIISECSAKSFIVHSSDIYSKSIGETENKLKEIFSKAISDAPSIILLEDLDSLCPMKSSYTTDHERRILVQLTTLFDDLHGYKSDVLVMATTSKLYSIDSSLRRPGRIDVEFEIYVPTPNMRLEILTKLISKIPNTLSNQDVQVLSLNTHGFVSADLHGLCSTAIFNAMKRLERKNAECIPSDVELIVTIEDFDHALITTKPSAIKEVLVEVANVRWTDIGGQKDLKLKLRQAVEWPLKFPDSFRKMGITPPKGVLMYGPPGCSKTMIAKALATESKVNFLNIKGPELFSKWVGESEKAVREVFRRARQVAPSIVFIDEIDALGGERSSSSGGSNVQERVLAQLLIELDGITALGSVTLVAATNRPDKIDKALLRPGRLDRIIYVGLPDEETRQEIFDIKLQKMPVAEEVNVADLVCLTEGYTGAEIQAICHEAAMKALEENIHAEIVTKEHFKVALALVIPRTPISLIKLYEDYRNNIL